MQGRQGFFPRNNFERQSYGRDTSQISFEEIPGVSMFRAPPIAKPVSIGGGRQHSINGSLINQYINTQPTPVDEKPRQDKDLSMLGKKAAQIELETLESKVDSKA